MKKAASSHKISLKSDNQLLSYGQKRFLSRVSTLTRDIDIAILSVHLSVCLSVHHVPVLDENGLTYCHSFSSYGSPIILVLSASDIFSALRNSDGVTPCGGAKYRWGIQVRDFIPIRRYVSQRIEDSAVVTMESE